jgi:class 3 adenylate cyclase
VSDTVRDLGLALGFEFVEAGARTLKGFHGPSQLFEL